MKRAQLREVESEARPVAPAEVALSKGSGLDDHIDKPFHREELYAAVERWTGRASPSLPGDLIDPAALDARATS